MSTTNSQSLEIKNFNEDKDKQFDIQLEKENLKKLISNDIARHTDCFEPIQITTDEILNKLTDSIGEIDFMLLAFPDSAEITKKFNALEKKLNLNGELSKNEDKLYQELEIGRAHV